MKRRITWLLRLLNHALWVMLGASALTLVFFLVLPFMQAIARSPDSGLIVEPINTTQLEPPPPVPEDEPPKEEEQKDEPPELNEDAPPLDLSQLELALNPGFSGDWLAGDFAVKLDKAAAGDDVDALFNLADLDQPPRVIYQPSPVMDAKLRRKAPGQVYVIFIVDQQGRVEDPKVQSSTDPIFERPALSAVKQWKFEPGKRNGKPVRFRLRVPVTFPKGQ